eukprot:6289062-Prymnesium_polylepis.1
MSMRSRLLEPRHTGQHSAFEVIASTMPPTAVGLCDRISAKEALKHRRSLSGSSHDHSSLMTSRLALMLEVDCSSGAIVFEASVHPALNPQPGRQAGASGECRKVTLGSPQSLRKEPMSCHAVHSTRRVTASDGLRTNPGTASAINTLGCRRLISDADRRSL